MLKSIVSLVVWMRRMTLTAPRAAQGSCSHGKDFVQFISCYEIEKWHSSSPFEKFLKKLAQTESDILFCCLSLCYIILEFFCQSLPSLTQKSTELIILLWESQTSRERPQNNTLIAGMQHCTAALWQYLHFIRSQWSQLTRWNHAGIQIFNHVTSHWIMTCFPKRL